MTTAPQAQSDLITDLFLCPDCRGNLERIDGSLRCTTCGAGHPLHGGVFDLAPGRRHLKDEEAAWQAHWSAARQQTAVQRFFSFYRKAVFARSVEHFTTRYFPPGGVFLEAGCGTAETSMRIDKKGGRTLIALDLVRPVLEQCHPVMDVRVRGDIFQLPFRNSSLDGIWNVGVMEHFLHPQIDAILAEFHRALKPGGRVILLWPAVFSLPQRLLRSIEWLVNLRRQGPPFRFHPDEISQLKSVAQGREVLERNGFKAVHIDPGFRSLMAFETLVGEK